MLEGVVPFPPEFARRYRERGYWTDQSLAQEFKPVFERFAGRVALIDRDRSITYAELDRLSDNLALNLLAIGLEPLDRMVVQLPNVVCRWMPIFGHHNFDKFRRAGFKHPPERELRAFRSCHGAGSSGSSVAGRANRR